MWIVVVSCLIAKQDTSAITAEYSGMEYIENDRIRLGINLSIGGAVTYLSDKLNGGQNMINSFDWGRQIQMSYYSGPWPYIGPDGEQPAENWATLGWNPIQSGDAGGNQSKVTAFERRGNNALFVRCTPMQWPHTTGVAGDCEFECLYTLKGNVITMEATLINKREDKTQYRACHQEMPAVYTNGTWYRLVSYLGDQPFTGQPVTEIVKKGDGKGWPWRHYYTPENWAALLDDNGMGIGVFQPEVMTFGGGFHPHETFKGSGGEKDGQTGNISPTGTQILDHNIRWTYTSSLVLGSIDDIRSYAKQNWKVVPRPEWVFDHSRKYWYYAGNAYDTGYPIKGELDITFGGFGSYLISPVTYWKAEDAPVLEIEGSFECESPEVMLTVWIQPVEKADFTDWLNWSEGDQSQEAEMQEKAEEFPSTPAFMTYKKLTADGVNRSYKIDLSELAPYTGAMKNLYLSFSYKGSAKIKKIKFENKTN